MASNQCSAAESEAAERSALNAGRFDSAQVDETSEWSTFLSNWLWSKGVSEGLPEVLVVACGRREKGEDSAYASNWLTVVVAGFAAEEAKKVDAPLGLIFCPQFCQATDQTQARRLAGAAIEVLPDDRMRVQDWAAQRQPICRGGVAVTPLPRGWDFTGQAVFSMGKQDCATQDWATAPLLCGLSTQNRWLVWQTRRAGIARRVGRLR